MFLKKITDVTHTLAFRLTLWYTMISIVSSLGAFVVLYASISTTIYKNLDQQLLEEIKEFSSVSEIQGMDGIRTLLYAEAESEGVDKIFCRVVDLKGKEVFSTNMSSWGNLGIGRNALSQLANGAAYVLETLSIPDKPYQVRIVYGHISPDNILQMGKSEEVQVEFLKLLQRICILVMAPLILLSAFVGLFMAKRALRGVQKVTETALEISKGDLEKRVRVKGGGHEIKKLASVFNIMLEHIEDLIKAMREVTDNIAHDLKTPVTRIRGIAESYLSTKDTSDTSSDFAADTIEECDYLLQMINTMLDISEINAGATKLEKSEINLTEIAQNAVELFRPLAAEKGINIIIDAPDHAVIVFGALHNLQRMIVNILENAIKYTTSGGTVTVSFNDKDKNWTALSIQDTGIGITDKDISHIFKRLYRCDTSRSQPGFGLGLSLAMAIANAHGGDIAVSSKPGKGSTFTITLPQ